MIQDLLERTPPLETLPQHSSSSSFLLHLTQSFVIQGGTTHPARSESASETSSNFPNYGPCIHPSLFSTHLFIASTACALASAFTHATRPPLFLPRAGKKLEGNTLIITCSLKIVSNFQGLLGLGGRVTSAMLEVG